MGECEGQGRGKGPCTAWRCICAPSCHAPSWNLGMAACAVRAGLLDTLQNEHLRGAVEVKAIMCLVRV